MRADQLVTLVVLGRLALQDLKVVVAQRVSQDCRESRARRQVLDSVDSRDLQDLKVIVDRMGSLDSQGRREKWENLDNLVLQVDLVIKVMQVCLVVLDHLDWQVTKVYLADLVVVAPMDLKVNWG